MHKGPDWANQEGRTCQHLTINAKAGAWYYVPYGAVVGVGAGGGGHWASVNWRHKAGEEA